MKDREDLLEIEIALLQAAGRRYGLLLERGEPGEAGADPEGGETSH